jgi:hypothetical protein
VFIAANLVSLVVENLLPTSLGSPSLKKTANIETMINDGLSTINAEPQKVQKIPKVYYDDATVIPIHDTLRASIKQIIVHDTGHLIFGVWPEWAPDQA